MNKANFKSSAGFEKVFKIVLVCSSMALQRSLLTCRFRPQTETWNSLLPSADPENFSRGESEGQLCLPGGVRDIFVIILLC